MGIINNIWRRADMGINHRQRFYTLVTAVSILLAYLTTYPQFTELLVKAIL